MCTIKMEKSLLEIFDNIIIIIIIYSIYLECLIGLQRNEQWDTAIHANQTLTHSLTHSLVALTSK